MHYHAGGLVHHEHVGVLVHDAERDRFRLELLGGRWRNVDVDPLAHDDTVRRLPRRPVHTHVAPGDQTLQPRPRDVGKAGCQPTVQALPGIRGVNHHSHVPHG
jgi:hypothetical protein